MYQDIYMHMSKHKKYDILSIMSNLQPNFCLKFDFQKVDQHAGGKWLIHFIWCRCQKNVKRSMSKLDFWHIWRMYYLYMK